MAPVSSRAIGQVQLNVSAATRDVSASFNRLSSGMRINSSADDPAGVGLSSALQLERRVLSQAVRNVSDGISMLSVADSAAAAMSTIVDRLQELAKQASSSSSTHTQRVALDQEADSLVGEYNRIVNTTSFNRIQLLSDTSSQQTIQMGESGSSITTTAALDTALSVGDGTYGARTTLGNAVNPWDVRLADINADGKLDIIEPEWNTNTISISIGNGDGTFFAKRTVSSATYTSEVEIADVNGDGKQDLIATRWLDSKVAVYLGNSDGTFQAAKSYAIDQYAQEVSLADLNGDGSLDLVTADGSTAGVSVLLNNGDGSFAARKSYSNGVPGQGIGEINVSDFNNDDIFDILAVNPTTHTYNIFIGNGDGTFQARRSYAASSTAANVSVADFNNDHNLDLVIGESTAGGTKMEILLGNGDGTFSVSSTLTIGGTSGYAAVGDVNGDGEVDIVNTVTNQNQIQVFIGNGDGSFRAQVTYTTGATPRSAVIGDVNGDGAADIAVSDSYASTTSIYYGHMVKQGTMAKVDLVTLGAASGAIAYLSNVADNLTQGRGKIASDLSRAAFSFSALQSREEDVGAAYSRVTDIDVAGELAALTAAQIRQQSGTAVAAHAESLATNAYNLLLGQSVPSA